MKLPAKLPIGRGADHAQPYQLMPSAVEIALVTNAGYKNRKPTITLMVQFPHSEVMMLRPKGCRSVPPTLLTS